MLARVAGYDALITPPPHPDQPWPEEQVLTRWLDETDGWNRYGPQHR